jgi:hypothetical protein
MTARVFAAGATLGAVALVALTALGAPEAAPPGAAAGPSASGLPIVVVGSHDRALAHWFAAARAGRLPRRGVTVVHVDAHPDLALPRGPLPSGWPESPAAVLRHVDIASFQLAAVRAGLVGEVVWLRPEWATQIPDGVHTFRIGSLRSGELRVDDPDDYYVLDGGWAPTAALADAQTLRLRVLPLDAAADELSLAEGPAILDVDLDAFATHNPAADRLRRAGLQDGDVARLREIFAPQRLALSADPETRMREVAELEAAIGALAAGEWSNLPGSFGVLWRRGIGPGALWSIGSMLHRARGPAADVLVADGREVVGLPERAADPAEIAETAERIAALIRSGRVRPDLITVSRSVDDGFTPREAWPAIEWRLLAALAETLDGATVAFDPGLRPAPSPPGP